MTDETTSNIKSLFRYFWPPIFGIIRLITEQVRPAFSATVAIWFVKLSLVSIVDPWYYTDVFEIS